jgi:hypothetical protein
MLVKSPKAQMIAPSLINISLLLIFGANPDTAERKTTAREAVVAATGVKSNIYKNIGTETIAPPAPIKPSTDPIKAPLNTAAIANPNSISAYWHKSLFLGIKNRPLQFIKGGFENFVS